MKDQYGKEMNRPFADRPRPKPEDLAKVRVVEKKEEEKS